MQESIQAALTVVRARAEKLGSTLIFTKNATSTSTYRKVRAERWSECRYCYVHRAGFLPDGNPVRADVAMTGEITLRGQDCRSVV